MLAQMDYIFFVYGFAFILLAAVCFVLSRNPFRNQVRLPWHYLALFGLLHGLNEWGDMLGVSIHTTTTYRVFILVLMTASFFFLCEFARQSMRVLIPIKIPSGCYIPLFCLMGLGSVLGVTEYNVLTRYALALPGGLGSAWVLYACFQKNSDQGKGFIVSAAAMALYALAAGLIVPEAAFFPANLIHQTRFLETTTIPIQVIRTLLALTIMIGLWFSYQALICKRYWIHTNIATAPISAGWPVVAVLFTLVLGWLVIGEVTQIETGKQRAYLLQQANLGSALIEPQRISMIKDTGQPDAVWIKNRLKTIRAHDSGLFRLFILVRSKEAVLCLADPEPDGQGDQSHWPDPLTMDSLFVRHQHCLVGPYTDARGPVAMAFATIYNPDNDTISGVFGIERSARSWLQAVSFTRLIIIFFTLFIVTLLIIFLVLRQRTWQTNEIFRNNDRRLSEAQHIAHLGGWDWDPVEERFLWSDEMYRIMGVDEETFIPAFDTLMQIIHPFDRLQVTDAIRKLLRGKDISCLEFRVLHADGDIRVVRAQGKTWCDATGKPIRSAGTILDITDQHKTEEELKQYREYLEQEVAERTAELTETNEALQLTQFTVDKSSDAIFWVKSDGHFSYVNDAACTSLGYTRNELFELAAYDINLMIPKEKWAAHWEELVEKKSFAYESSFRKKDGSIGIVDLSVNYITVGNYSFDCAFARDITARKQAEQAARLLAAIVESSDDGIYSKDRNFTITSWNESAERLYGFSREEAIGKHVAIIVPPEYMAELRRITALCEKGERVDHFRTVRRRKNGDYFDISLSISPLFDEAGQIVGSSAIARDISERIRMEEALRTKTEELDRFFNVVTDLLAISDISGRLCRFNSAWEKVLGYTEQELKEIVFLDLIHPEDRISMLNAISQMGPQRHILNYINRCRCKDGTYRWFEWHSTLSGNLIFASARDITERRQAELELQKLALVVKNANELICIAELDGHMVFLNEAGSRMIGISPDSVEAYMIFSVISESYLDLAKNTVVPCILGRGRWEGELQYCNHQTGQLVDVYATTFLIRDPITNLPLYMVNVSLDISERKSAEAEREELIRGLQEALAEVKELSGLLPICANCKKIRDDSGYWTQIEQYLHEHSGTRFSHGICPDCLKKFYPEYAEEVLQDIEENPPE